MTGGLLMNRNPRTENTRITDEVQRNMRTVIVYGSQYGTAKRYAEALAGRAGSEIRSHEDSINLDAYDNIVYIGALYTGGVPGLKKTLSDIHDLQNKKIVIATVGLAGISRRSWLFLILSGLATGASWLCYYKALQIGEASKVVPIDKLSVVITLVLAFVFLNEEFTT